MGWWVGDGRHGSLWAVLRSPPLEAGSSAEGGDTPSEVIPTVCRGKVYWFFKVPSPEFNLFYATQRYKYTMEPTQVVAFSKVRPAMMCARGRTDRAGWCCPKWICNDPRPQVRPSSPVYSRHLSGLHNVVGLHEAEGCTDGRASLQLPGVDSSCQLLSHSHAKS